MVFHWSLSDSKSPQVSRTLLSTLADLNIAVVLKVLACPLISMSSCPCTKPLMTIPSAPITIGITVTLMFHGFPGLLQGLGTYHSFRFLSVLPCSQPERHSPQIGRFSLFLFFCYHSVSAFGWALLLLLLLLLHRLLLGRLAFVPDGVSKSMADSRPKRPQLRLAHLRVGELQPLSPMYSTRPCCLVQAITRHTCPDPDLDSWNCLPH